MTYTRTHTSSRRKKLAALGVVLLMGALAACSGDTIAAGSDVEGTGKLEGDDKLIVAFIPSTATAYIGAWWGGSRSRS